MRESHRDELTNDIEWDTEYLETQSVEEGVVIRLPNDLKSEALVMGVLKAYKSKFAKAQQTTLANGVERINGLVGELKAHLAETNVPKRKALAKK